MFFCYSERIHYLPTIVFKFFENIELEKFYFSSRSRKFLKWLVQCYQTFSSEPARTILKPAQLAGPQFLVLNSKKMPGPRKFILCSNRPNRPPAQPKFFRPRKPWKRPTGPFPAQSGNTVGRFYDSMHGQIGGVAVGKIIICPLEMRACHYNSHGICQIARALIRLFRLSLWKLV